MQYSNKYWFVIILILIFSSLHAQPETFKSDADIVQYISNSWDELQRSVTTCKGVTDPKTKTLSILYFPFGYTVPAEVQQAQKNCDFKIAFLPNEIVKSGDVQLDKILEPGLLYLPNPYIVPGSMFNEMYGWDSYFIIRGLLAQKHFKLAKGMIENFFFELDHYGVILNANRTYYLTRSQPPFLTSMIREYYVQSKSEDLDWLQSAYLHALKDYKLWVSVPHLNEDTKLSRYRDLSEHPELFLDVTEADYYTQVKNFFKSYSLGKQFLNDEGQLNNAYYEGDRAMRESGFDTTLRFGRFSAETNQFAPVELNCLLFKAENDLAWMSQQLGKGPQSIEWAAKAALRKKLINQHFWNEKAGLYFDYYFPKKGQSTYVFATTFFPLWVGAASTQQAQAVKKNLKLFERPGGLMTSPYVTGAQWDAPFVWAPLQLIAIEGLNKYGFKQDAIRIATEYTNMVLCNFRREHTIHEKYNGLTRSSDVSINIGYSANVVGFGWTNGVYLVLKDAFDLHPIPNDTNSKNPPTKKLAT